MHPPIWTTYTTFFERQCAKKIGQGVSPPPLLPIPKLTQYIQFVKSGQKFWAGHPPPLIWTKNNPKEQLLFFGKPSLTLMIRNRLMMMILRMLMKMRGL